MSFLGGGGFGGLGLGLNQLATGGDLKFPGASARGFGDFTNGPSVPSVNNFMMPSPPVNPGHVQRDPNETAMRNRYELPDSMRVLTIPDLIIFGAVSLGDTTLFTVVLPIINFLWQLTSMRFQVRYFPQMPIFPVAETGVPRFLQNNRWSKTMNFTRYAIGQGMYSNERLHTGEGDRDQALDRQQIAVSVREHLKLLVIYALLDCHADLRDMLRAQGRYEVVDIVAAITADRDDFAALQKVEYGYNHVFNKHLMAMRRYGGEATTLIANRQIAAMFPQRPELTKYYLAGPQGPANAVDYDQGLANNTPLPNIIYLDYNPAVIGATLGPLQRATQIGGWHVSKDLDELRRDGKYAKKYSSQCRAIRIFNQEVNSWAVISLSEMQDNAHITTEFGELITNDERIPFLFGADTFGAIPLRYFSNDDLKLTINVLAHRIAEGEGKTMEHLKGAIARGLATIVKMNTSYPLKGWLEGVFIVSQENWRVASSGTAPFRLPSLFDLAESDVKPVPTTGRHTDKDNINYLEFPVSSFVGYATWEGLKLLDEYYQSKKNYSHTACPDDWQSIHEFVCVVEQIVGYWRSTFHGVQTTVNFELQSPASEMALRKSAEESLVDQAFNLNANFALWIATSNTEVPKEDLIFAKEVGDLGGGSSFGPPTTGTTYTPPSSPALIGVPTTYAALENSSMDKPSAKKYGREMAALMGYLLKKKTQKIMDSLETRTKAANLSTLSSPQAAFMKTLVASLKSKIDGYADVIMGGSPVVYVGLPLEYSTTGGDLFVTQPPTNTWLEFDATLGASYQKRFATAASVHWATFVEEDFDALLLLFASMDSLLRDPGSTDLSQLGTQLSQFGDAAKDLVSKLKIFKPLSTFPHWTPAEIARLLPQGDISFASDSDEVPDRLKTPESSADTLRDLAREELEKFYDALSVAFGGAFPVPTTTTTSIVGRVNDILEKTTLTYDAYVILGNEAAKAFVIAESGDRQRLIEFLTDNDPLPLVSQILTPTVIADLLLNFKNPEADFASDKHPLSTDLIRQLASIPENVSSTSPLTLKGLMSRKTFDTATQKKDRRAKGSKFDIRASEIGDPTRTPLSVSWEQARQIANSTAFRDDNTVILVGPSSDFFQPFPDGSWANYDVYNSQTDLSERDLPFMKSQDRVRFSIAGAYHNSAGSQKKHRYDGLFGYRTDDANEHRENRLTEFMPKAQPFDRLIALLYCCTEMTLNNLQSLIDNNIPYPFNYMVVRPWMNYITETIIMVYPGIENCGFLGIAGADEEKFRTGITKESGLHASFWAGAVVTMPQNVKPIPNIAVTGYGSGGGVLFYTSAEQVANKQIRCNTRTPIGSKGSRSCLSFAIAKTESPKQEWISLTGKLPMQNNDSGPQYEESEDHFSTAQFYNEFWGFVSGGIVSYHHHDAALRAQESFEGNSICWRGTTWYWNPLGHNPDWTAIALNAGPLGRDEGPGSQEIRKGNANFKCFDYASRGGLQVVS